MKDVSGKIDAVRHDLNVKDDEIKRLKRADRENLVNQAFLQAKVAYASLGRAMVERDDRVAQLLATKGRLVSLSREAANLSALAASYGAGLREKVQAVEGKLVDEKALSPDEQKLEKDLRAALLELEAELERLRRPENRLVTADVIQSIAPALALGQLRPTPADKQVLLDRANASLLRCARWLNVLGAGRQAIAVGTPCQSSRELRMAVADLDNLWKKVRSKYSGVQHKVLILSFGKDEIDRIRDGDRLTFRTAAEWFPRAKFVAAAARRDASRIFSRVPVLFNTRAVW